jgi:hypothetical protein
MKLSSDGSLGVPLWSFRVLNFDPASTRNSWRCASVRPSRGRAGSGPLVPERVFDTYWTHSITAGQRRSS